jgi:ATP-dependent helicase/DNAse subunit B
VRVLTVLPDVERVEEQLLREVTAGQVQRADHVCTWDELVLKLAHQGRRAVLDRLTSHALLGRCANRVDLSPFGSLTSSPHFVRAAADVISALKAGALTASAFSEAAKILPEVRRERSQALARLFRAYEEALAERNALDEDDLAAEAARQAELKAPLPRMLAQADEVHFDSMHNLLPAAINLIVALGRRASEGRGPRVKVRLPFTHSSGVNVFLEPTFRALEGLGQSLNAMELEPFDPAEGNHGKGVGRFIASRLFNPKKEPLPTPEGLHLIGAPSPEAEAREVARRIRDRLDAGAAADEVAVVVRTSTPTIDRLLEYLERYGVPTRPLVDDTLRSAPPFRVVLSMLDLLDRDFPREPTAGLLRSRYLRFPDQGELRFAARVLREAGIRDDVHDGGYLGRLKALVKRTRAVIDDRTEERVKKTDARVGAILRALEVLKKLPASATLARHCQSLSHLLEVLGMAEACSGIGEAPLADDRTLTTLARDQEAFRALSDLLVALPQAYAAAGRGDEELERTRFRAVLADAAGERMLEGRGQYGGAVRFLDATTLAGREIKHAFVVGLNDGLFPARPEPHPLLPEEDRIRINIAMGRMVFRAPAPGSDPSPLPVRQSEEPLLFYQVLCAATETVELSYSRLDGTGRESLRSPFIDELERKLHAKIEPAPLAPVPMLAQCRSTEEVLARASLEGLAEPALRMGASETKIHPVALVDAVSGADPNSTSVPSPAGLGPGSTRQRWESIHQRVSMERERLHVLSFPDARPGRFSGATESVDLKPQLEEIFAFTPERSLTAKQLDEFGTCPFKSFAIRVLKLRPTNEAGEDTDSRTRGDVLHRVLQAFYERMRKENRLPLKGQEEEKLTLLEVADDTLIKVEEELHVGHPELWRLRKEEALERLLLALQTEQQNTAFSGLVPAHFELETKPETLEPDSKAAHGPTQARFVPLPLPADDGSKPIFIGGKIDRVDVGGGRAAVVDYKSASARYLRKKIRERLLDNDFQLVTYLALVQGVLGHEVIDAAFVSLRDHEVVRLSEVLEERGLPLQQLLKLGTRERNEVVEKGSPNYAHKVWSLVHQMRAGQFPVRSLDCTHCDFAGVCRVHSPSLGGDDS